MSFFSLPHSPISNLYTENPGLQVSRQTYRYVYIHVYNVEHPNIGTNNFILACGEGVHLYKYMYCRVVNIWCAGESVLYREFALFS